MFFPIKGGTGRVSYDRIVGSFENLNMCHPTPWPLFSGKPCYPYTKPCITHIVLVSECVQGIVQRKSASGCRTLPLVMFDKKVLFFSKNSVILSYFWVKLSQKCPFWKILGAVLKIQITLWCLMKFYGMS